ncbi:EAL domain-containing protein [Sphingomonas oligophenolica]|uniref:EAL domain-containing protein n=2 Tax=Sphingomonas oligophenolica TaxID=301154 RepID=A0A502CM75_9SPHN|nr:EAL domain-containing protein [Sphingomonas oligophenolica]
MVAVLAWLLGIGTVMDRVVDPWRFAVLGKAASGRIHIVEMDAASTAAIKHWPWSRANYAQVVDRLIAAGAASVVFDVDVSSAADAAGDRAFAESIAAARGKVALPTFGQQGTASDRRTIDAFPLPMFRNHATLASVSMGPDGDGVVRQAPLGTMNGGIPRPSLSALMARRSGRADSGFPIDFGIDPDTIPRSSFVAIRDGHFDPRSIAGRDVVIGATAIEMGDRYATPRWGVLPGVVIQALAAETLLRGVPVALSPVLALLVGFLAAFAIGRVASAIGLVVASVVGAAVAVGLAIGAQAMGQMHPLSPALIMIAVATGYRGRHIIASLFRRQRVTDETTQLPNRHAASATLANEDAVTLAVARIGNFDALAGVLGTASLADAVLRTAERLKLTCADGIVYRIDDRCLAWRVTPEADLSATLDALRTVMLRPIEVQGRRVDVTLTVGIDDGEGSRIDASLIDAVTAAENAARLGVFWTHAATDRAQMEREVSLMGELDDAIAAGEIVVYYQPKLSLATDRIASVEALVRWCHPTRGFIGPDHFIPLAEQTDRIAPLTLVVLEQTMRDVAAWQARGHCMTAAVNISAKLLTRREFTDAVRALLAQNIVAPDRIVFEVTESAAIADPAAALATLETYRDLGIAISMDDYGTGQSTLTYLKQLPLSELKIDRLFVQHAHRDRADAVMVRSTVDMAHALGLKVVAEGIEDAEALAFLRGIGCDMAQGYFISKPVPSDDLIALVDARLSKAA